MFSYRYPQCQNLTVSHALVTLNSEYWLLLEDGWHSHLFSAPSVSSHSSQLLCPCSPRSQPLESPALLNTLYGLDPCCPSSGNCSQQVNISSSVYISSWFCISGIQQTLCSSQSSWVFFLPRNNISLVCVPCSFSLDLCNVTPLYNLSIAGLLSLCIPSSLWSVGQTLHLDKHCQWEFVSLPSLLTSSCGFPT